MFYMFIMNLLWKKIADYQDSLLRSTFSRNHMPDEPTSNNSDMSKTKVPQIFT